MGQKELMTMRYKGKVYRPPSEAYSLIVQVTYGCSHNRCAFCDMYDDKHFAMRPMAEIREDFETARQLYRRASWTGRTRRGPDGCPARSYY